MADPVLTEQVSGDRAVRMHVFAHVGATGRIPSPAAIATALDRPQPEVEGAIQRLAAERVWFLAPGTSTIWVASPFCGVPSNFRVRARGRTYWGICIWDALGIAAALDADAVITARGGDDDADLVLEVRDGALVRSEGVVHFALPARQWWANIAFT